MLSFQRTAPILHQPYRKEHLLKRNEIMERRQKIKSIWFLDFVTKRFTPAPAPPTFHTRENEIFLNSTHASITLHTSHINTCAQAKKESLSLRVQERESESERASERERQTEKRKVQSPRVWAFEQTGGHLESGPHTPVRISLINELIVK